MASTRAVLQVFEKYQKDRVAFVQTVAELATRPQNIEPMQSAGVMALLRPLLLDNVAERRARRRRDTRSNAWRAFARPRTHSATRRARSSPLDSSKMAPRARLERAVSARFFPPIARAAR